MNDSLLIGILLSLVFGAIAFYLYSRMSQTEKRLGLMENLLLQIKLSTEASLEGPDSIRAISEGMPLNEDDVESVDAEEYSEMLKEIPIGVVEPTIQEIAQHTEKKDEIRNTVSFDDEDKEEETPATSQGGSLSWTKQTKVEVNYEAMSLNELKGLAKQKGIAGYQQKKKRELIDLLKKSIGTNIQDFMGPTDLTPLEAVEGDLAGGNGQQTMAEIETME